MSRWTCRRCGDAKTRGLEFDAPSGSPVAGGGARVRGCPSTGLAGGVRRGARRGAADRRRRDLDARRDRLKPSDCLRVVAFLGAVLVLAKMCDDEGLFEAAGAAMARGRVGSRRLLRQVFVIAADHHRGVEPGRHGGTADPGGVDHGSAAAGAGSSARLRHCALGQCRIAVAAGVESDQPACLSRRKRVVHQVHLADDAAVAGRGGHRLRRFPGVLPPRPQRATRSPARTSPRPRRRYSRWWSSR